MKLKRKNKQYREAMKQFGSLKTNKSVNPKPN